MNRCPITYELCEGLYSKKGIHLLSKTLKNLKIFPFTQKQQIQLADQHSDKLSIQGLQPKLSVILNLKDEVFEIVDIGGRYILKPPHPIYDEVPQNEDLTMRLAKLVGINVPLHGLIYNIDNTMTYFIKRFDRTPKQKIATEDFSQLSGFTRETKYESSMEKVASLIDENCTFPAIEKQKLFRLTLFNFLVGNEDMHLKNFTLIRHENQVELSPAYDLLNTSIVLSVKEEIALPIKGKKSKLSRSDLFEYFGLERLKIPELILNEEFSIFEKSLKTWFTLIDNSFLSQEKKDAYKSLINERWTRIGSTNSEYKNRVKE